MARPRKPTAVLALSGSLKHNPKRYETRINEPKPSKSIGPPPAYFDPERKAIWAELKMKAPPGVLTISDEWLMEMAVSLMQKLRQGNVTAGEYGQLQGCMRSMGMSPADRSRVHAAETSEQRVESQWDRFLKVH